MRKVFEKRIHKGRFITATARLPREIKDEIREFCEGKYTMAHVYEQAIKLGWEVIKREGLKEVRQ